jgi:hypothetical protein
MSLSAENRALVEQEQDLADMLHHLELHGEAYVSDEVLNRLLNAARAAGSAKTAT